MNSLITFSILGDITGNVYTQMEYVNCLEKIDVLVKYSFFSAAKFNKINFDAGELHVRQLGGGEILCSLEKKIPVKLFEDVKNLSPETIKKNVSSVILGYIYKTLPTINNQILTRKYLEGHILARTISLFDLKDVGVVSRQNPEEAGIIIWPTPFVGFPFAKELAEQNNHLYTRDLMDAMAAYFDFNFDECIRKIITSLENYFIFYKLKPATSEGDKKPGWKIMGLIETYIRRPYYLMNNEHLAVIRENIKYIYGLRIRVVHNKLRIHPRNISLCKKSIITLCLIYESTFCAEVSHYAFTLQKQFRSHADDFTMDIEKFEKIYNGKNPVIIDPKLPNNQRYLIRLITSFIETNCVTLTPNGFAGSPLLTTALYNDLRISKNEKRKVLML
jgi:hypothetical protein